MGIGYSTAHHGGGGNPALHTPDSNTNSDGTQVQDAPVASSSSSVAASSSSSSGNPENVPASLHPHSSQIRGRSTSSSASSSLSSSPNAGSSNITTPPQPPSSQITSAGDTTTSTVPIDLYEAMGANFRYYSTVNGAHRIPEMAKPEESDNIDQQPRTKPTATTATATSTTTATAQARRPITKWQKGELIGAGSFGKVYLGMNCETGELIAVKEVTFIGTAANIMEQVGSLQHEIELLKNLDHENIVRYLGVERVGNSLNIFLEYVPGGSIASLVSKFGRLKEMVIRKFTKQILEGLLYLHENRIIHRDIKGANVLVDVNGSIKLTDFGASKQIADIMTITDGFKSLKGTPYWMAPEVIMQTGHGRAADIWSVGCTVLEMATGRPPWSDFQSQVTALFHIAHSNEPPTFPSDLSEEAKDFLLRCFERNPKVRATAAELLKHPFITEQPDITKQPHRQPAEISPPLSSPSALGYLSAERSRYGEPRGFGDAPSRASKQDNNANFNFSNTATAAGLLNAKDAHAHLAILRADLSPSPNVSSTSSQTQLPLLPTSTTPFNASSTRSNWTPLKSGNQESTTAASHKSSVQIRFESIPEPNLVEEPDSSDSDDDNIETPHEVRSRTHPEQTRLPPINPHQQIESDQSLTTSADDDESTDMSPSSQEKAIKNFLRTKSKRDGLQLMTDDMLTVFRTRLGRFADTPTAAAAATRDSADNEMSTLAKDRMEYPSQESQMMILPRRGRLNHGPRDHSPDRGEQHSSTIMPPLRDDDIERLSQHLTPTSALAKQKQQQQSRLLKSASLNSNLPQPRSLMPHLEHGNSAGSSSSSSRSTGNLLVPLSSDLENAEQSHPASAGNIISTAPPAPVSTKRSNSILSDT